MMHILSQLCSKPEPTGRFEAVYTHTFEFDGVSVSFVKSTRGYIYNSLMDHFGPEAAPILIHELDTSLE